MPYKNCPSCHGTGHILEDGRHLGTNHVGREVYEQIEKTCSSCEGSGRKWTLVQDNPPRGRGLWGHNDEFED